MGNIFFKSYGVDETGVTLYVFDSTYLPSPEEIGGDKQIYDLLIDRLLDRLSKKLPSTPYSLVIFTSGFSAKKISWVYGVRMFSRLPADSRKYLQRAYIVHESFFVRTVYQVISNAMSLTRFSTSSFKSFTNDGSKSDYHDKIVHVPNLTSLAELLDITKLRISLNVYLHDYEVSDEIKLPRPYFTRLTSAAKRQYRQLVFDKIFNRLKFDALTHELVFQKPGSYKKINILLDVVERNNYLDISQWDVYSLGSVFAHFIRGKSKPMVPIDMIHLPVDDSFEYTLKVFKSIIEFNNYYDFFIAILPLFISMLNANTITKHDARSLSRCLTPTLCKEKLSVIKTDRLSIGSRYIKNLFEWFPKIVKALETPQHRVVSENSVLNISPALPRPRKWNLSCTTEGSTNLSPTHSRTSSPVRPLPRALTELEVSEPPSSSSISVVSNTSTINSSIPRLNYKDQKYNENQRRIVSDSTLVNETASVKVEQTTMNIPLVDIEKMVRDEDIFRRIDEIDKSPSNEELGILDPDTITEKFEKIQIFDRALQKEKKTHDIIITKEATKFSHESYAEIKTDKKVSKLVALYEERVMGLQAINELKSNEEKLIQSNTNSR